jgi:hypothetical protein
VWQRGHLGSRRAIVAAVAAGGVAVAVAGWWLSRANPELMRLGLLRAVVDGWQGFSEQLHYRLLAIREEVLGTFSQKYAWWVLILTLLVVVVSETLRRLTLIHAGLAWFGYARGQAFPFARFRPVWIALIVTQLAVLLLFAFLRLFLVDRYTVALGLTIALAVPFALAGLKLMRAQTGATALYRLAYPAAMALVLLIGIEALDVRTDKKFLKQAGRWIATQTAPDARVYANNQALAWYTGRDAFRPGARYDYAETLEAIRSQHYREYDWLALVVGRAEPEANRLRALLGAVPEQSFSNPRGDKVLLFRVAR